MRSTISSLIFALATLGSIVFLTSWRTEVSTESIDSYVKPSAAKAQQIEQSLARFDEMEVADAPGTFPMMVAREPADIREVLRYTRGANEDKASELTQVALLSPDPLIVGAAMRGLARLGTSEDDANVAALVKDERPAVRQEAIRWMGKVGDKKHVSVVIKLASDHDATVRRLAIQALGRMGGDRARNKLESIQQSSKRDAVDRVFAREALKTLG